MARKSKKRFAWLWAAALFFSAGYFVTALSAGGADGPATGPNTTTPTRPAPLTSQTGARPERAARPAVYATVALVALMMPFGARARGALRGALRGLTLGLAGAFGISMGLSALTAPLGPEALRLMAGLAALTTMILCAATGAIFGLLAERRHRRTQGDFT